MGRWQWDLLNGQVVPKCLQEVLNAKNGGEKGQRKKARGAVNLHNRSVTDEDRDNSDK